MDTNEANYMSNKKRKIIIFIILDIILIFCTIFAHNLFLNYNANENLSVKTIVNSNGSLTIKIFTKPDWKIALVYLISFSMSNAIILSIVDIIGYINKKAISLKNKMIIILPINLVLTVLLFPSMVKLLLIMDIIIISIFLIIKIKNNRV
jgi:hypothetical protein